MNRLEDILLLINADQRVIIAVGDQDTCDASEYKIVLDLDNTDILTTDIYKQYKLNRVTSIESIKDGIKIYVQENYESNSDRRIIKSWKDAITVPEETKRIASTYIEQGYTIDFLMANSFRIQLDDGQVNVYWKDGVFWEEILKEDK